ncbi:hypothetical protein GCM10017786_60350 [Amycolatopsis deserti]|uniref:Uncharacterized protein n=1 Tax=Amycolatopsis deserti TaxID=185696 RepID=A0ABQ3JC84_9PSEU|nr:hypothetical protein [Amycolatopsis deserti]GHF18526.1 hypothetical protein GCM10017786_60350 [Amycolatopsis deserti]
MALLARPVGEGRRGFAFVLPGCAETGAVLDIRDDRITADLVGGENVNCATANYFLATFAVDTGRVSPSAKPVR